MIRYSLVDCGCQKDWCDAHLAEDPEGLWVFAEDLAAMTAERDKVSKRLDILLKECQEAFPDCHWPTYLEVLEHIVNAASNQRCDNGVLRRKIAELVVAKNKALEALKRKVGCDSPRDAWRWCHQCETCKLIAELEEVK
jgi:7-cyano-7-deazaguanine synthase in queuosine biosynthesis